MMVYDINKQMRMKKRIPFNPDNIWEASFLKNFGVTGDLMSPWIHHCFSVYLIVYVYVVVIEVVFADISSSQC